MSTKFCKTCQQEKPATPEYFHRHRNDLYPQCKSCKNAYSKTEKGRKVVAQKTKKWHDANPDKRRVKQAVKNAVKRGRLPRVSTLSCAMCGQQSTEYHHGSYEWEDRLNVIALCQKCHKAEHEIKRRSLQAVSEIIGK